MKIAFLSYEYPPETGGGGIGTYLAQMVKYLPQYGHKPVVFCGTNKAEDFWENEFVYRIHCRNTQQFNEVLIVQFEKIHNDINFDIAEGTDFAACGLSLLKSFPSLPFVVRAHSANFIVDQYLYQPLKGWAKWRFILGAIKRFQLPNLPKPPSENDYPLEKEIIQKCDAVLSPSHSLGEIYKNLGWINDYYFLPYLYQPTEELVSIQSDIRTDKDLNIVFYGRLEIRKGVLEIAEAIPSLLKKYPLLKFYFIGKSTNSPISGMDMKTYLQNKLKKHLTNIIFKEAFQPQDISRILIMGDIFLIPSRYDNSPLVCFETMSAAKAVIGSNSGGMAEIIEDGISGLLVEPKNPKQIIEKVSQLVESAELRIKLGQNARTSVLETYTATKIITLQLDTYKKVIDQKKLELQNS